MKSDLKGLHQLEKNLSELSATHSIPLGDLMNPSFISSCSQYSNFEALIEASGFKVKSKEDFAAIPDHEWEQFIQTNTSYESWIEMQQDAGISFYAANLTKGLK
ncbi:hypothetical protein [Psychrobacter sp. P11G5]|uniref:hypothetical protein n=1 Tax=Psychrobacter sp. P11G5 TaxID=1699624 RepID=UPI00078BC259|nr:hypothetical protein [Psychrobacter sp. P11G5]AMN69055.1 hypothetical protein AK825_14470 [Psychrobacter sp. P11G5]